MATLHLAQTTTRPKYKSPKLKLDQNTIRPNYNLAKILLAYTNRLYSMRGVVFWPSCSLDELYFGRVVVWASCRLADLILGEM